MGCGCKNNNQQSSTPQQQKVQPQQITQQRASVNEDIKTAIKKTVEKYYNVNKNTK